MKILFTGGGTGGHFYPIIAVAEELNDLVDKEKILENKLYYMSNSPYDRRALFENGITFISVTAGKRRIYSSFKNFLDLFKMALGVGTAIVKMFVIYPDVVFSKGAYASFPALFAARLFGIPVIIHESDTYPGRVNMWSGKFAKRIALSYPEAAAYFPKGVVAVTGQPIRREIRTAQKEGAFEYLNLDATTPVIFVLGGSQGAELINNMMIDVLPELLKKYQVIHQVGVKNFNQMKETSTVVVPDKALLARYHPVSFLTPLLIKMYAGASSLIISRAGSTIFEIAGWGLPSILIPFEKSNGDHSRKNAFSYARSGACIVVEETNLTPHVILAEVENIMNNPTERSAMSQAALRFATPDAARMIAQEIIDIALAHEK